VRRLFAFVYQLIRQARQVRLILDRWAVISIRDLFSATELLEPAAIGQVTRALAPAPATAAFGLPSGACTTALPPNAQATGADS
jgi:hypothetical protein